jgi:hypothetical protein
MLEGECDVERVNNLLQVSKSEFPLIRGEHFGEISLIYGCDATATVISRVHTIYAILEQDNY